MFNSDRIDLTPGLLGHVNPGGRGPAVPRLAALWRLLWWL